MQIRDGSIHTFFLALQYLLTSLQLHCNLHHQLLSSPRSPSADLHSVFVIYQMSVISLSSRCLLRPLNTTLMKQIHRHFLFSISRQVIDDFAPFQDSILVFLYKRVESAGVESSRHEVHVGGAREQMGCHSQRLERLACIQGEN
jgi:hypothetical protein